mmetsp:Transcript_14458/g.24268  ORF Transcript_14458/g.24268 Transcript_14458/m.24268 type:complete len:237 (+) Transcript_14458:734-1444(+)
MGRPTGSGRRQGTPCPPRRRRRRLPRTKKGRPCTRGAPSSSCSWARSTWASGPPPTWTPSCRRGCPGWTLWPSACRTRSGAGARAARGPRRWRAPATAPTPRTPPPRAAPTSGWPTGTTGCCMGAAAATASSRRYWTSSWARTGCWRHALAGARCSCGSTCASSWRPRSTTGRFLQKIPEVFRALPFLLPRAAWWPSWLWRAPLFPLWPVSYQATLQRLRARQGRSSWVPPTWGAT